MLGKLKQFFAPPQFEDEEKTRSAYILSKLIWFTIMVNSISALAIPLVSAQPLPAELILLFVTITELCLLLITKRGKVRLASIVFVGLSWVAFTIASLLFGGLGSPAAAGYLFVLTLAGLLLGSRGAVAVLFASILGWVSLFVLQTEGLLPPAIEMPTLLGELIALLASLFLVAVVMFLFARNLLEALQRARKRELELTTAYDSLEDRVAQRTEDLVKANRALQSSEARYKEIFQSSPTPLVEQDFSQVKQEIDELRQQSVEDFEGYLRDHPEFVQRSSELIVTLNANRAALDLYGAETLDEFLVSLDKFVYPDSLDNLRDELVAIALGEQWFEGESLNRTLEGEKLYVLIAMTFPAEADGFDNVLVSVVDITARKEAEQEREQLLSSEREQRKLADTLGRISTALNSVLHLNEVLELICIETIELLEMDAAYIWLVEGDELVGFAPKSAQRIEVLNMRVPIADSSLLAARVVREQRPIGISDPENSDLVDAKLIKHFGIKAILGTPLIKGKESIGSLVATSTADDRKIDEYTLSRASVLADSAAVAISNAQLYEESRRLVEEMTAVSGVLHALNASNSLEDSFTAVAASLRSITRCDRIGLSLIDKNRQTLRIETLDRQHDEFGEGTEIILSETAASENILAGIPHISPVLESEQDYPMEKALIELGYRSRIVLPLIVETEVIGGLSLIWRAAEAYDERLLTLLEQVADAVALAVEKDRLFKSVQNLAITDELTGLFNRRRLMEQARLELERAIRFERSVSFVMLDIDYFKRVNDTYGHLVGDEVLRALADLIRENVREIDVVGRYGGEEFAVLMPETVLEEAHAVAERLRLETERMQVATEAAEIAVTISLGVATTLGQVIDLDTLITDADNALYTAKDAGRNCVRLAQVIADPET